MSVPPTIVEALRAHAAAAPERGALVAWDGGERRAWTYAELDAVTDRIAAGLAAAGLRPGARLALALANTHAGAFYRLLLGAYKAGVVPVPVNARLAPPETAHIVRDSGALRLVAPEAALAALAAQDLGRCATWPAEIAEELAAATGAVPDPPSHEDPADLLYTSGTTGLPKGAAFRHRSLAYSARALAAAMRLDAGDVLQTPAPVYTSTGTHTFPLPVIGAGATYVAEPAFDAERTAATLEAEGEHGVLRGAGDARPAARAARAGARVPLAAGADVRRLADARADDRPPARPLPPRRALEPLRAHRERTVGLRAAARAGRGTLGVRGPSRGGHRAADRRRRRTRAAARRAGRDRDAGADADGRLPRPPRGHARRAGRRLAAHGRRRPDGRRRLRLPRGPHEGPHRPRRVQRLPGRDRGGPARASRRARGGRRRHPHRVLGEDACAVVVLRPERPRARRSSRPTAPSGSPTSSGRGATTSSTHSRATPWARSSSASCARSSPATRSHDDAARGARHRRRPRHRRGRRARPGRRRRRRRLLRARRGLGQRAPARDRGRRRRGARRGRRHGRRGGGRGVRRGGGRPARAGRHPRQQRRAVAVAQLPADDGRGLARPARAQPARGGPLHARGAAGHARAQAGAASSWSRRSRRSTPTPR